MTAIKKPETSPKIRERCKELYGMLRSRSVFTKEQIASHFNTSERSAREMISEIAHYQPVIATSDKRGYRLAMTKEDYEDARHQWAELDSRIAELEARKKPLIRFCDKVEKLK